MFAVACEAARNLIEEPFTSSNEGGGSLLAVRWGGNGIDQVNGMVDKVPHSQQHTTRFSGESSLAEGGRALRCESVSVTTLQLPTANSITVAGAIGMDWTSPCSPATHTCRLASGVAKTFLMAPAVMAA